MILDLLNGVAIEFFFPPQIVIANCPDFRDTAGNYSRPSM